jgi:hypothetical protein
MKLAFPLGLISLSLFAFTIFVSPARAQEGPLDPGPPKDTTPEEIIKRFAEK